MKKERGFSSKQNTLFNTFITVLHHRTTSSVGHNNWMGVLVVIWVRVSYCEWCEEGTMMHCHILLQHFKRWNFGGSPFSVGVPVGWAWVESKVVKIRGRVPLWGTKKYLSMPIYFHFVTSETVQTFSTWHPFKEESLRVGRVSVCSKNSSPRLIYLAHKRTLV